MFLSAKICFGRLVANYNLLFQRDRNDRYINDMDINEKQTCNHTKLQLINEQQ